MESSRLCVNNTPNKILFCVCYFAEGCDAAYGNIVIPITTLCLHGNKQVKLVCYCFHKNVMQPIGTSFVPTIIPETHVIKENTHEQSLKQDTNLFSVILQNDIMRPMEI